MLIKSNEHFLQLFNNVKTIKYSHHFLRDVRHERSLDEIDAKIIAPENSTLTEYHKFEEQIEGAHIFRAKKERFHVVYAITDDNELIFLRAIKNFSEYTHFLRNKNQIQTLINSSL